MRRIVLSTLQFRINTRYKVYMEVHFLSSAIYKFGIVPIFITVSRKNAQKIYVASVYSINNILHSKIQPESYWTQLSSCSYFVRQVALTAISL